MINKLYKIKRLEKMMKNDNISPLIKYFIWERIRELKNEL